MLQNNVINKQRAAVSVLAAGMLTVSAADSIKDLRMPKMQINTASLVVKSPEHSTDIKPAASSQETKLSLSGLVSSVSFVAGGLLFARGVYRNTSDSNKYTNLIWTTSSGVATLAAFASADKVYGYSQLAVFAATVTYTSVALVKYKTWSINKLEKICTGAAALALGSYAMAKFGAVPGQVGKILNDSSIWLTVATAALGGLPLWSRFFRKAEEGEVYKPNWKETVIPAVMPWSCFVVARVAAWISTDGASSATTYSSFAMLTFTSIHFIGQFRSSLLVKNSEKN